MPRAARNAGAPEVRRAPKIAHPPKTAPLGGPFHPEHPKKKDIIDKYPQHPGGSGPVTASPAPTRRRPSGPPAHPPPPLRQVRVPEHRDTGRGVAVIDEITGAGHA
jgi:hypothetical protein